MKYIALNANNKNVIRGLLMLAFVLVSSTTAFAQTENSIVSETTIDVTPAVKVETTSTLSSSSNTMNFVLWFMGSKQEPKSTISIDGVNARRQVITSGVAPNRLLLKAFLKKAVDLDSMLA